MGELSLMKSKVNEVLDADLRKLQKKYKKYGLNLELSAILWCDYEAVDDMYMKILASEKITQIVVLRDWLNEWIEENTKP